MHAAVTEKHSFDSRVLADVIRAYELQSGGVIADPSLEEQLRSADVDFESKLIRRAHDVAISDRARQAVVRTKRALRITVFVALVCAIVAGAGAAIGVLQPRDDGSINIVLALIGLLGVQTFMLFVWLALMIAFRKSGSGAVLGAIILSCVRWIVRRMKRDALDVAGSTGTIGTLAHASIGRWLLSSISHGIWIAFSIGCIAAIVIVLSARQVTFTWETTILPDDAFVSCISAAGALPASLGFDVPDESAIAASRWPEGVEMQSSETRQAWSAFLIAALALYGFVPRFALGAVCVVLTRRAMSQYRLNVASPGFARLCNVLEPAGARMHVVLHDDGEHDSTIDGDAQRSTDDRPIGKSAILGLEIAPPATGWPPRIPHASLNDLGMVESGADQKRALNRLTESRTRPQAIVIVVNVASTPDRGTATFLSRVRGACNSPLSIVLSGGQTMRSTGQGESLDHRMRDWQNLVVRIGLEPSAVHDIDLDHLTVHTRSALAQIVGAPVADITMPRGLAAAFVVIRGHAAAWSGNPTAEHQVALHRDISDSFDHQPLTWRSFVPTLAGRDVTHDDITDAGKKWLMLLPERLRVNSKWAVAGALTGGLACVAASMLASPAAIGALPLWSAIGGAVGTLTQRRVHHESSDAKDSEAFDFADAARSATLFALVLYLQGRSESDITRILDQTLTPELEAADITAASLDAWLTSVHDRAMEATSRKASGGAS